MKTTTFETYVVRMLVKFASQIALSFATAAESARALVDQ
jgi:hypothetical protein